MKLPASQRAEESVLGAIFREPKLAGELIGAVLEPRHFYFTPYRLAFERIVESYYADETIDALTVGEAIAKRTAKLWEIDERAAVDKITALATAQFGEGSSVVEHAHLIRRHSDLRGLLRLSQRITEAVAAEEQTPEEIAGAVSQEALRVATGSVLNDEIYSYGELGRRWTAGMKVQMAAREAGVELGAYFSIPAIDNFTKGLRPTELLIAGGEPGVGKTAAWVIAGKNFAVRQMAKPVEDRIGTLILSLEMGEEPSSGRWAQALTSIDSAKLREATLSRAELMNVARAWAAEKELPLYVGHMSSLKQSQLRAVCVEQVRKHHVGLVIIDHFRQITTDRFHDSRNEADDEVVRFLKEVLAKDLNLAVICLAHTVKAIERADKRPQMNDLRGSGAIQAFADFISFLYRPYEHASESNRDRGAVHQTDAEMIWAKSRHSGKGTGDFYLNIARMQVQ